MSAAIAAFVGLSAALTGVIDGIVLMTERTLGTCHHDSYDTPCYLHPRAGEGLAISAISLGVGAVVVLLASLVNGMSRGSDD